MAVEYGDIWPQASGSASLGAEMSNGGLTGDTRPFAHIHSLSGILHDPLMGQSGVIRYVLASQQNDSANGESILPGGKLSAFEFSLDGGQTFPIRLGAASGTINEVTPGILQKFGVLEAAEGRALFIRSSGLYTYSQGDTRFLVLPYDGDALQKGNFVIDAWGHIQFSNSNSQSAQGDSTFLFDARDTLTFQSETSSINFNTNIGGQAVFNVGDQFIINVYKSSQVSPSSGVFRYQFGPYEGWYWKGSATNGNPLGNVLPSSGAVNQMIQESRFDIGSGLQKTYDASHEATLLLPTSLRAPGFLLKLKGGTKDMRPDDARGFVPTYGIAVSGFTLAPSNPHSYGISFLGHNALSIQGSGISQANLWLGLNPITNRPLVTSSGILDIIASGINIASQDFITYVSIGNQILTVGGVFAVSAHIAANINCDASIGLTGNNINLTSTSDIMIQSQNGVIDLETSNQNNDIKFNPTGDCFIEAQNHSGKLSYRFGPYQSWHQYNSWQQTGGTANDGFFPMPHSGHINQMIQASRADIGSGLRTAYKADRLIIPNSVTGDLQIISDSAKTSFSTFGTQAELNLSGVFTPPTLANLRLGDLYMMNHSVISGIVAAQSTAIVAAQALGIGTVVLNTGSGIINISVGSGIMQCINNGVQTITAVASDVNLNFITESADQNYTLTTATGTSGVITVMSPGLYKVSYKIAATKTVGTTPQFVETTLIKNNNGVVILGSTIDSFHFDTTAAKASATATLLQNLDAGDNLRLQVRSNLDGTNNCQIPNRGAIFIIEKIGPKRGIF